MPYTFEGTDQKVEVLKGTSVAEIRYYPRVDGVRTEPSATASDNTIAIYSPGGEERVAATNLTKSGTGATAYLKYTLDASNTENYPLAEDYRVDIRWKTTGGESHADRLWFDVVLTPLPIPIDDNDLLEREPDLLNKLADLAGADTNARRYIVQAWQEIRSRIEGMGWRPALIIDRHRLVGPAVHLALHNAFAALARSTNDANGQKAEFHLGRYNALWEQLGPLKYDRDDGGVRDTARAPFSQRRWTL